MSFAALRDRFFRRYLELYPEEATTLGAHAFDDRLSDLSEAGLSDALAFWQSTSGELSRIDPAALATDDAIDAGIVDRLARFSAHALGELRQAWGNLEASLQPNAMISYQAVQAAAPDDFGPIAARLAAVPRFLAAHEENLRAGLAAGRAPDAAITRQLAAELLPAAARHLGSFASLPARMGLELPAARIAELDAAAAEAQRAYQAHAGFVEAELLPRAAESYALGRDEYARRLELFFGTKRPLDEIAAEAEDTLARAGDAIVEAARKVARPGERVSDLAGASTVFFRGWSAHPESTDAAVALYRGLAVRIERFVRERRLVTVPEGYEVALAPLPPAIAHGTSVTNWPVPLLDPHQRGFTMVAPDPRAHSIPGAANLFAHEAIPGHHLQSLVWQRAFAGHPSPVRFLLVADDVAFARQAFGPMLNIEGWAAYMEEVMLEHGLYTDEEALLSIVSKAIRAARVVLDIRLHAAGLGRVEAAAWLARSTAMPLGWCEAQVLRYTRIPIQAITYHLGRQAIGELLEARRAALGSAFELGAFHDRFLSFGPVPPALLRDAMR